MRGETNLKTAQLCGPSTNASTAKDIMPTTKKGKPKTNHSSLDRNYPSLQAIFAKYRQNTNY